MTRPFATATAIAAALIAISPTAEAGQMINVAPQPNVDVAPNVPNVPRPQVNRPAVTPRPDTSRVLVQKENGEDDGGDSGGNAGGGTDETAERGSGGSRQVSKQRETDTGTVALVDRAPIPPAFPKALAKAAPLPPGKPERVALIDEDNASGFGSDAPPLGQNDADRLREQFRGGVGVERAEELARLKEMQELGWLEFREGAFGGDGDCGPGVNLPAGTDLHGLGCDSGGTPETDSRPGDDKGFLSGMPLDPDRGHGGYPMPSPDDGIGGNNKHPDAWIGGGGGSAKGNADVKGFGQGAARGDPARCLGMIPTIAAGNAIVTAWPELVVGLPARPPARQRARPPVRPSGKRREA